MGSTVLKTPLVSLTFTVTNDYIDEKNWYSGYDATYKCEGGDYEYEYEYDYD